MAEFQWAQICGDGHIRYVASNPEGLSGDLHCDWCGSPLYSQCQHCNAPLRAEYSESEDGDISYRCQNNCYHCGADHPWKPSRLQRVVQSIANNTNSRPSPSGVLLTESIRNSLEETKYGHEVISHIREGDRCYRNSLWQPALSSYIHAFEWAAITFLEFSADQDIIEQEAEGKLYYFAKGRNNLLDELQNHVAIDQKTISRLEAMNRAERRWMAHHKQGTTLPDEVDAVRARLEEFLVTLFE